MLRVVGTTWYINQFSDGYPVAHVWRPFSPLFFLSMYLLFFPYIYSNKKKKSACLDKGPSPTPRSGRTPGGRVTDSWPEARLLGTHGIVEPITSVARLSTRVETRSGIVCFCVRLFSICSTCYQHRHCVFTVTLINTTVVPFIMSTRRICAPYFTTFAYRRQRLHSQQTPCGTHDPREKNRSIVKRPCLTCGTNFHAPYSVVVVLVVIDAFNLWMSGRTTRDPTCPTFLLSFRRRSIGQTMTVVSRLEGFNLFKLPKEMTIVLQTNAN